MVNGKLVSVQRVSRSDRQSCGTYWALKTDPDWKLTDLPLKVPYCPSWNPSLTLSMENRSTRWFSLTTGKLIRSV